MKKKVLFLLLDAFRGDYINQVDTPFLFNLSTKGIFAPKLKSVSGFTQRTAIYCGTMGDVSGMFTMYTFDLERSPFHFLKDDPKVKYFTKNKYFWEYLPSMKGFNMLRRTLKHNYYDIPRNNYLIEIKRLSKKYADNAPLSYIPLNILSEIGVSEDNKPIYLPGAFDIESIFDVFVRENIPYKYLMYPIVNIEDDAVVSSFIENKDSDVQILLGQFSDSDYLIHHCGPSSKERHKITAEIDRKLRMLYSEFGDDVTWIIIGDHGMTDVQKEINIQEILKPIESSVNAIHGRDYCVFLDSTMARFLWKTKAGHLLGKKIIENEIFLKNGQFVDEEFAEHFKIPFGNRRYGDLIWCANLGTLIFPDYFHDKETHNKGMHGYISEHDDMKGFFLAYGSDIKAKIINEVSLIDVCPSICRAAGVTPPKKSHGHCLLD